MKMYEILFLLNPSIPISAADIAEEIYPGLDMKSVTKRLAASVGKLRGLGWNVKNTPKQGYTISRKHHTLLLNAWEKRLILRGKHSRNPVKLAGLTPEKLQRAIEAIKK